MITEVLLHGEHGSTLLVAAEAYSRDNVPPDISARWQAATLWYLHDESVVVLPRPAQVDTLDWIPQRRPWRPSHAPARRGGPGGITSS